MTEHPLHEPERRQGYKEIARTIDERMAYLEGCFQRWLRRGLIAFAIIGITSTLGLWGFGLALKEQQRNDAAIKALAVGAKNQSQTAIDKVFQKEKICSDTSKTEACRALFERLIKSLTEEQKFRVACLTADYLKGSVAEQLRRDNPKCGG